MGLDRSWWLVSSWWSSWSWAVSANREVIACLVCGVVEAEAVVEVDNNGTLMGL